MSDTPQAQNKNKKDAAGNGSGKVKAEKEPRQLQTFATLGADFTGPAPDESLTDSSPDGWDSGASSILSHEPSTLLLRRASTAQTAKPPVAIPTFGGRNFCNIPTHASTRPAVQPKLTVGAAHDAYEQEADDVAEQVMRMPAPVSAPPAGADAPEPGGNSIQRAPEEEEIQTKPLAATIRPFVQRTTPQSEDEEVQRAAEEEDELQTKRVSAADSFEVGGDFENRVAGSSGGGSPLPAETRAFMEPRFGADFSGVRLHSGGEAAELNRSVSAQAFTLGRDIYLGEGQTDVASDGGKRLIAHELTHVVQQGGGSGQGTRKSYLVQRSFRYLNQVFSPESDPHLAAFDRSVAEIARQISGISGLEAEDLQDALSRLRELRQDGRITCWNVIMVSGNPVYATYDSATDEIRLHVNIGNSAASASDMLHEGIHAVHGQRYPRLRRLYAEVLAAGGTPDRRLGILLLRWAAWTEYWAYRRRAEFFNLDLPPNNRVDPHRYALERSDENIARVQAETPGEFRPWRWAPPERFRAHRQPGSSQPPPAASSGQPSASPPAATGGGGQQSIQRVPEEEIQARRVSALDSFEAGDDFENRVKATGDGSPLSDEVRTFMEPRFGIDFSGVRLHSGGEAADLNRQVSAQAFTLGRDIYLGEGKTDVASDGGKRLIAHELTHVVQQTGTGIQPLLQQTATETRSPAVGDGAIQAKGGKTVADPATARAQRPTTVRALAKKTTNPNIVQRVPITVSDKQHNEKELLWIRDTILAEQRGLVGAMFNIKDDKFWKFFNDTAFCKFMASLQENNWDMTVEGLPKDLEIYRKNCSAECPAKAVVIGKKVYQCPVGLMENILAQFKPSEKILLDEKLLVLARDPINRWIFANWKEVSSALESWDGKGPYSKALMQHRVPVRPTSVKSTWDPTGIKTPEDVQGIKTTFNVVWGACGNTAEYMISRIHDLKGDVTLEYNRELEAKDQGELWDILTGPVKTVTLFNISNRLVHEFTIEKRPSDQAAVLHQGYLSAYNSLWWAGLEDILISLKEEGPKNAITAMREVYGGKKEIDIPALAALAKNLSDFMSAPTINSKQAKAAWGQLPFNPGAAPNSEEKPNLIVRVWHVGNPKTVIEELEKTLNSKEEWVTTAVQKEVLEVYKKIIAANKK